MQNEFYNLNLSGAVMPLLPPGSPTEVATLLISSLCKTPRSELDLAGSDLCE
jgi:hypothetical protein